MATTPDQESRAARTQNQPIRSRSGILETVCLDVDLSRNLGVQRISSEELERTTSVHGGAGCMTTWPLLAALQSSSLRAKKRLIFWSCFFFCAVLPGLWREIALASSTESRFLGLLSVGHFDRRPASHAALIVDRSPGVSGKLVRNQRSMRPPELQHPI